MTEKHLILLHGALGTSDQLRELAGVLQDRFVIHTLNFAGHGGNAPDFRVNMEFFGAQVATLLGSIPEEASITIFGYSMGGYAGILASLPNPQRIHSIITLGTVFHWSPELSAKEIRFLDPEVILSKVPRFAEKLQIMHGNENWKPLLQRTADMMTALGERPLLSPELIAQSQLRLTIVCGDQDTTADPESSRAFAQKCHAEFILLENTPHPFEKVDVSTLAQWIEDRS